MESNKQNDKQNNILNNKNNQQPQYKQPISKELLTTFLLLTLVPLILLSIANYWQARNTLKTAIAEELQYSANNTTHLAKKWFDIRAEDTRYLANSSNTINLLQQLSSVWQISNQPLKSFIHSNTWKIITEKQQSAYSHVIQNYAYAYDVFIIDTNANILYTYAKEDDLGANLITGKYKNTLFASTVQKTLKAQQTFFSGAEHYSPSKGKLAGFITTPIINDNKKTLGVFAIQLNLKPILNILLPSEKNTSRSHFIINEKNQLITPIKKNDWSNVLNHPISLPRNINNKQITSFLSNNKQLLGFKNELNLLNIHWSLISTINSSEAYASANWLAYITVLFLIITIITIIIVSVIVIKKVKALTIPIQQLVNATVKARNHDIPINVEINKDNEIHYLAETLRQLQKANIQQKQELLTSNSKIQQALKALTEQKHALDEHAIVAITDRKGTITFVNKKFVEISGYSEAELIGQNHRILNSGRHDKSMWKEMYQLVNQGKTWHGEVCNKAKDGHLYWVDTTIVPFTDMANNIKNFIAIRTDISKRKKIEAASQENVKQLELVVNNTGVGFWNWDVANGNVVCNQRWYEITGYSENELAPFSVDKWSELLHPDDAPKVMTAINQHFAGELAEYFCELRLKHKSGRWIWVLDSGKLVAHDENNKPKRMIGTVVDISQRKQQEQATQVKLTVAKKLSENISLKQRLDNAIDELFKLDELKLQEKGGVFLLEAEKNNLAMCSHRGKFSEQFLCDEQNVPLGRCLCGKSAVSGEIIISDNCFTDHRHENSWPDMQAHGHYIIPLINKMDHNNTVVGVVFLYTDVNPDASNERIMLLQEIGDLFSTAIIQDNAQKLLKQASIEAEQSAQLKSEFLASMSHEIRTPMNGVLGMLILLEHTKLNPDQHHKVTLAKSSAQALLTLINDILDFSKIEAGKLELEIIDFDLRKMLGEFAEAIALRAQEKGIEIILDITHVEQSMVKGDPSRLRQILTNLVGNAIKFTEQGEILITLSTQITHDNKLTLQASVKDTGIGIPADKISGLFNTFTQVDASTTRKYGGTGLGLAICKQLCQLMGGDIKVTSTLNQGSCFSFNVTLFPSKQSQQVLPTINISQLHLLIVDDNATNRFVLREQLSHWGAKVSEAENAKHALTLCAEQVNNTGKIFDAALLDMQMPEMDGEQLGKLLLNTPEYSSMKLIMMTSIANNNEAQYFAQLGFSGFFPKPATSEDILGALAVIINNGDTLKNAPNIVTSNYLTSLDNSQKNQPSANVLTENANKNTSENISEKTTINENGEYTWPDNTRILLVEDNRINQQVALGVLKQFNLTADIANHGKEALEMLLATKEDNSYTLILMDCQMPELDGYQTSEQIRAAKAGKHYNNIPIIAMTANAMQGDKEKCLNAGMNDYLTKPIEPNILKSKLITWLIVQANNTNTIEQTHSRYSLTDNELLIPTTNLNDEHSNEHNNEQNKTQNEEQTQTNDTTPAIWDKSTLMERISNSQELLILLIENFLDEIPEKLKLIPQEIVADLDEKQQESIHFHVHTIKGIAANLGGEQMQQTAKALEVALKEKDLSTYQQKLQEIENDFQLLSELLQEELT